MTDGALRLGVYGGTFDPPHLGHLILAETAAESLQLARVLFVPAGEPPHKSVQVMRTPVEQRIDMVERAIAGNKRFTLSRTDVDRPGPHFTVDMLRLLKEEHPQAELIFLIGSDSLRDLPVWFHPEDLLKLAQLGVMRRPGDEPDLDELERQLPTIRQRILWVDAPLIGISSSELSDRIGSDQSVRYQIPDAVYEYILEHDLYRKS